LSKNPILTAKYRT